MTDRDGPAHARASPPDNPTLLFEEYVLGIGEGQKPDVDELLRRAGERRAELEGLLRVYRTLETMRDGTTGGALPRELRGAGRVSEDLPRLGRYHDLQPLGQGGLSRVYLAQDTQLQRRVALKVLTSPLIDAAGARAWMLNEGRSLARLEHPGVVRVFEVGEADGLAFIAMEHVDGPSLREVLRCLREMAGTPEPEAEPVSDVAREAAQSLESLSARTALVAHIAEALAYCHANGVIHRDIKPANVLIVSGTQPRLIDFGLAHLESSDTMSTEITQRLVGTPAYIAPEQIENNRTGASELSDQFSLGVMLVELLTLKSPFARESRTETLEAITHAARPQPRALNPGIPEDLERICLHALERDPRERYSRVVNLADDLSGFLEHRTISLQPPTLARSTRLWMRRNRRAVQLAGLAAVLLLLLFVSARIVQIRQQRAPVLREVNEIADSLPQRHAPSEFSNAYMALNGLQERAADIDGSLLGSLLFDPLSPRVTQVAHACSRRVKTLLDERMPSLERGDEPTERESLISAMLQQWTSVLKLDELVCPDCDDNAEVRQRGSVLLPDATPERPLHLFRHVAVPDFPVAAVLEPVADPRNLEPGFYRLLQADREQADPLDALELDFTLRYSEPRWTLVPQPMPPALRARLLPCNGGSVVLDDSRAESRVPQQTMIVAPFFIDRQPVTWRDLAAAWGDETVHTLMVSHETAMHAMAAKRHPELPDSTPSELLDDPAILIWRLAQQYATECGARLPTLLEWRIAQRMEGFIGPVPGARPVGEWTSGASNEGPNSRYVGLYGQLDKPWTDWAYETRDTGLQQSPVAFRLARSHP